MKIFLDFFWNILGRKCEICQYKTNEYVCKECLEKMIPREGCFQCIGYCTCNISTIVPFFYSGVTRQLVLNFKYYKKFYLGDFFAKFIAHKIEQNSFIVPVPMSKEKLIKKGFNQTFVLAESIKKIRPDLEIITDALYSEKKEKNNFSDANERFLKSSAIKIGEVSGIFNRNIIILDDIIASGATISRCVRLLSTFAKNITVSAIAKV